MVSQKELMWPRLGFVRIDMKKMLSSPVAALLILGAIAAVFQFSFAGVADPDSLYHIIHAKIYREQGFFDSSFPWLQYSVINKYQADIWYGFHLLLIPFTFFSNGIFGIKLAGVLIAVATLAAFFAVLRKLGARWPLFWTALLFFSIPDVYYRLLMARPHNISLALAV